MSKTANQGQSLNPAEDAAVRTLATETPLATWQPQSPMPYASPYDTVKKKLISTQWILSVSVCATPAPSWWNLTARKNMDFL